MEKIKLSKTERHIGWYTVNEPISIGDFESNQYTHNCYSRSGDFYSSPYIKPYRDMVENLIIKPGKYEIIMDIEKNRGTAFFYPQLYLSSKNEVEKFIKNLRKRGFKRLLSELQEKLSELPENYDYENEGFAAGVSLLFLDLDRIVRSISDDEHTQYELFPQYNNEVCSAIYAEKEIEKEINRYVEEKMKKYAEKKLMAECRENEYDAEYSSEMKYQLSPEAYYELCLEGCI